ncbi:TBC1 domain family member 31 [Musca domestica]|uniref:TBC1 domain family member 31 n=1 Tax=Musca domestica TaxID=7370 RepID=A0A1I8MVB6_MUSDO|nr:TBC1 domain family member 31 [Musca domestica]
MEINPTETNLAEELPTNCDDNEKSAKCSLHTKKIAFKLKENNGNILTIHHTVRENDKMLRIVISVACFDMRGLQLVAVDRRGTIFVFDLVARRYWRHADILAKPSAITASYKEHNQYIVGNKEGFIVLLDVDKTQFLHKNKISNDVINEITFPGQPLEPKCLMLIRAGRSAIIMDFQKFTCTHRLDFDKLQMSLKYASYLPQSENILTCFTNDSIHIWSGVSLEVIRVIYPIRLRDKKLQTEEALPELTLDYDKTGEQCANINTGHGLIAAYAYRMDGSIFALSTWDKFLLFLSPYTFELTSLVNCKNFVLLHLSLLTKPNDQFLIGLTNRGSVVMFDCINTEYKLIIDIGPARSIKPSLDNKYLTIGRSSGELALWSICHLLSVLKSQQECMTILRTAFKQTKPFKLPSTELDGKFQDEIKKLLTPHRLQQILQEFHCYPAKYRSLIWCSLLVLPHNKVQYSDLVQMGTPPTIARRCRSINMKNDTLKRALIKCWSSLSQWCKVLAHSEILPDLIFPFVKIFQQNHLVAFEVCMTVITNQFQLFFEYHPLEPSSYLGLCANILQHYDKMLFDYFVAKDVTPTIYAWNLLKNSFSEVLDEEQWMCLWDNILSGPTYYLIFVVVAYNIMQKEILLRLPDKFIIERFYHDQNPVDVRKLILKTQKLLDKCPGHLHPKRYMSNFQPIPQKVYPKFLNYPNECLKKYEDKVLDLQSVNTAIDTRMRDLELEELEIMKRLEDGLRKEEHTKRLKEVEKYYQDTLRREEERINCQRKMLLLYRKELRHKKAEVAAALQEAEQRKGIFVKEHELHSLQYYIEQERMCNDINLMWAEEELQNQDLELLAQKSMEQHSTPSLTITYYDDICKLQHEQKRLNNDIRKIVSPQLATRDYKNKTQRTKKPIKSHSDFEAELEKCQMEFLSLTGP